MASVWDLIVRLTGDSGQFREDMAQDKVALEDLLNSVHDAAVDIDLDDADAEAKLDELNAKLDALRDASTKIDLDDLDAEVKLDDFKRKLESLKDTEMRIILGDDEAKAKLDKFKADLEELRNSHVAIDLDDADADLKLDELKQKLRDLTSASAAIDIDDADAKAKIDDIKEKLDAIRNASVHIDMDDAHALEQIEALMVELDRLEARIQEVNHTPIDPEVDPNGNIPAAEQRFQALQGAILTAIPAISSIGAPALMWVGQLATLLSAATAGVAGFAAVAIPDIEDLTQHSKAAAQEWADFQKEWASYRESFDPIVMQTFTDGLKVLSDLMTDMRPVIQAAAQAIDGLLKDLNTDLSGSGAAKFFDMLAKETGPAITAFGESAINIFKGLAGILEAFAPTVGSMQDGLVNATAAFARWGEQLGSSSGFQQFLDYARQEGPQVLELIGNLAKTIGDLLVAMAPAGALLLQVANGILNLVNNVLNASPAIGQFGVAFMQGIGVMKLIGPAISTVLSWVAKLAPEFLAGAEGAGDAILGLSGPIGWIVAAVVAAVTLIITHWDTVKENAQEVWSTVTSVWQSASQNIQSNVSQMWSTIQSVWNGAVNNVQSNVQQMWTTIRNVWQSASSAVQSIVSLMWNTIQGVWNGAATWFEGIFRSVGESFSTGWRQIAQYAQSGAKTAYDGVTSVWNAIVGWFTRLWSEVSSGISKSWQDIRTTLTKVVQTAYDAVTNIWNSIKNWFVNLWTALESGVTSGWAGIRSALSSAAQDGVKAVTDEFDTLGTYFSNLAQQALQWGANVVHMIANGIRSAIGDVESAASSVASAISSFLGFHSPTEEGPASDSDTWAPNFINMFTSGLEAGIPKVRAALNQVMVPPDVASMVTHAGTQLASTMATTLQVQYQQNAPVYGVDDLNGLIGSAVQTGISKFVGQVTVAARASGIRRT